MNAQMNRIKARGVLFKTSTNLLTFNLNDPVVRHMPYLTPVSAGVMLVNVNAKLTSHEEHGSPESNLKPIIFSFFLNYYSGK